MKAQRSLRDLSPSSTSSQTSSEAGPSTTKEKQLVQIKAKLAEMQRRKGKVVNPDVEGDDLVQEEEAEVREADRLRRESKHAFVAESWS